MSIFLSIIFLRIPDRRSFPLVELSLGNPGNGAKTVVQFYGAAELWYLIPLTERRLNGANAPKRCQLIFLEVRKSEDISLNAGLSAHAVASRVGSRF